MSHNYNNEQICVNCKHSINKISSSPTITTDEPTYFGSDEANDNSLPIAQEDLPKHGWSWKQKK